jgi:heme-degrading monooxygenase HmoA
MGEIVTTGRWRPMAGHEGEFVEAWRSFASWANSMPGAGTLRLTRDAVDAGRFVSFGSWRSDEAVRAWKSAHDFRERIARVLEHVDEFEPAELMVVATVVSPAAATPIQAV